MPYRQDYITLDGSHDGHKWTRIHLMTATETQRMFDSLALQANRPLFSRDFFLYDNDIKPGQNYIGERGYLRENDPVFEFYRLNIGKDMQQIMIFFRRSEKEL
jgi:hypothetical protein